MRSVPRLAFSGGVKLTLGTSAVLTLAVRALGLLSQRIILGGLGANAALDGYFIALILPALLVTPIGAALEAGFAPAYGRALERKDHSAAAFARRIMRRSVLGAAVVALVSFVVIDPLIALSAPAASEAQRTAAEVAARWVYPAMGAQIVAAACRSVLYGRGRFQVPIVVGAFNPVVMIALLLADGDFGVAAIARASAAGFVVEAVVLLLLVRDVLGTPASTSTSAAGEDMGISLGPLLVTQVLMRSIFYVDQVFASGLDEGSLTQFAVALRLYDVAAAILVMPNARIAAVNVGKALGSAAIGERTTVEMRRALKVGVVAAGGLATGGPLMVGIVLENGAFTGADVTSTMVLCVVFAAVLVPASSAHVGSRSIVAIGAVRTLALLGLAELVANIALNLVLAPMFGAAGIALATGIAYVMLVVAQRRVLARCRGSIAGTH